MASPAELLHSNKFSYNYYEEIRKKSLLSAIHQQPNHIGRNLQTFLDDKGRRIALCHVPIFVEYTQLKDGVSSMISSLGYDTSAGAMLAMYHWNNGNGVIVKDIEGIDETCPIRFTTEVFDTESSPIKAMSDLVKITSRSPDSQIEPQPCAVLGTVYSSVSVKLASLTGIYDLLQVSNAAASVVLEDRAQFPLFTRTHPSSDGEGQIMADYLFDKLNVVKFAVVYVDDAYGNAYHDAIQRSVRSRGKITPLSIKVPLDRDITKKDATSILNVLKDSETNYVVGVFFSKQYEIIMEAAGELGVAGPGKLWIFCGSLADKLYFNSQSYEKGSSLAKATNGNAVLITGLGIPGVEEYDSFLDEWASIGNEPEFLEFMNSKQPNMATKPSFNQTKDYFYRPPKHYSMYSYEAIIGMGLSACEVMTKTNSSLEEGSIFTGKQHHDEFLGVKFSSATGMIEIAQNTISRSTKSTYYVIVNIRESASSDGAVSFQGVRFSFFDFKENRWNDFNSSNPFVYANGSVNQPPLNDVQEDKGLISNGIRLMILVLCTISMWLTISFVVYTFVNREKHSVRLAQPPFLIMICVGAMFMLLSTITLSMDEGAGLTKDGLDACCQATPWFMFIGFVIIFSALFSKLWRLNKIIGASVSLRRSVEVTATDVLVPFFVLLISNVIILATKDILHPIQWVRTPIEYNSYEQVIASKGQCSNGHNAIYFGLLLSINFISVILACHQAYRCWNMITEMNESKVFGMAMICIFQSLFFGIPLLITSWNNRTNYVFIVSGIIFVICVSTQMFTFLPIIFKQRESRSLVGRTTLSARMIKIRNMEKNARQLSSFDGRSVSQSLIAPPSPPPSELNAESEIENCTSEVFPSQFRDSGSGEEFCFPSKTLHSSAASAFPHPNLDENEEISSDSDSNCDDPSEKSEKVTSLSRNVTRDMKARKSVSFLE